MVIRIFCLSFVGISIVCDSVIWSPVPRRFNLSTDLYGIVFLIPVIRPPPRSFSFPFCCNRSLLSIVNPGIFGVLSFLTSFVSWIRKISMSFFFMNSFNSSILDRIESIFSCRIFKVVSFVAVCLYWVSSPGCGVSLLFSSWISSSVQFGHTQFCLWSVSTCFLVIPQHCLLLWKCFLHLVQIRKSSFCLIFCLVLQPLLLHLSGVIPSLNGCVWRGVSPLHSLHTR